MTNRVIARCFIGAACTALLLTGVSCEKKRPPGLLGVGGHDTPIIIQGGSLWIWAENNFAASSTQSLSVPTTTPLRSIYTAYNPTFTNATLLAQLSGSWILCTGDPQDVQYVPDAAGDALNVSPWVSGTMVFSQEFGTGSVNHDFAFGRLNVNMAGFGGLYFGTAGMSCPSIISAATTPCTGTPTSPCQIAPRSQPIFVALTH